MVEVALTISLLGIPLLLGTSVMATVVYDSIEVANAAHAGALYGMQSLTFASNTAGISTAAQAEASDFGSSLSVSSSTFYVCSNSIGGTQYTGTNAQANATAACTGGSNHALQFVQVTATITVTPPIHCRGLPTSYPLSNTSIMEVEQ